MGSLKADEDDKKEMDDSGYVQDEGPQKSTPEKKKPVNLLDLSDDVLLCIFKYCEPLDLKALGFTCTRLAGVARDRALWTRVDARAAAGGARRLRWLLAHALHAGTARLLLRGYAAHTQHCNGYHNVNRPACWGGSKSDDSINEPGASQRHCYPGLADRTYPDASRVSMLWPEEDLDRKRVIIATNDSDTNSTETESNNTDSKSNNTDSTSNNTDSKSNNTDSKSNNTDDSMDSKSEPNTSKGDDIKNPQPGAHWFQKDPKCPGPRFTMTPCLLRQLRTRCNLTMLALDYCNINCARISLSQFPRTLTWLSLRGTACYNMTLNKSLLFQIQEHLPNLQYLDLSECGWLDASCLLPLSKLECLRELAMKHCARLREFVAYASISARYGFRKLKVFDLRGSPLGDSETAALGWLPELEELHLSGSGRAGAGRRPAHNHFADDVLPYVEELADWELQEPEYFKSLLKQRKRKRGKDSNDDLCCHGVPFSQCTDGLGGLQTNKATRDLKRTRKSSEEPGPSKRKRSSLNDTNSSLNSDDDDGSDSDEDDTNEEICANTAENVNNVQNNENGEVNEANGEENEVNDDYQLIELRPRAHVLYVNVGQQLNPVHRLVNLNEPRENRIIPTVCQRINLSELITDTAIRSFGHSDDENINYFHIGGHPPQQNYSRPNKSNLKILSMIGYKNITDKSLEHLRTSAPKLEKIDFTRTGVTKKGVDMFKLSRPEVEIVYSPFVNDTSQSSYVYGLSLV